MDKCNEMKTCAVIRGRPTAGVGGTLVDFSHVIHWQGTHDLSAVIVSRPCTPLCRMQVCSKGAARLNQSQQINTASAAARRTGEAVVIGSNVVVKGSVKTSFETRLQ